MNSILREIEVERYQQDRKWGGPKHDDFHSHADFVRWIINYANWSLQKIEGYNSSNRNIGLQSARKARRRMIQVAALAVAAIEKLDRLTAKE